MKDFEQYVKQNFHSDVIKKYILDGKNYKETLVFCEKVNVVNSCTYPHVEDMFIFTHNNKYYGVIDGFCGSEGLYSEKWGTLVNCYELKKIHYKYQNCEGVRNGIWGDAYSYKYIIKEK